MYQSRAKLRLGGPGCCINHARSVSVCSEELRWKRKRGERKCRWIKMERKVFLWETITGTPSTSLGGRGNSCECCWDGVSHWDQNQFSFSCIKVDLRGGVVTEEEEEEKERKGRSVRWKNQAFQLGLEWGKCEFGSSLGLNGRDKVWLCPHAVDLHLWWVTDGLVAGQLSLLVKCYCYITCFIPIASSMSVIKRDVSSSTHPASSFIRSPSLVLDWWPQ